MLRKLRRHALALLVLFVPGLATQAQAPAEAVEDGSEEETVSEPPALAPALAALAAKVAEREAQLGAGGSAVERATRLLETGRHDQAHALVGELLAAGRDGRLAAVRALFAVQDFAALEPLMLALAGSAMADDEARRLVYRWWLTIDDLERLDGELEVRLGGREGSATLVDRLARAQLDLLLLDFAAAEAGYRGALELAASDLDRSLALHGLGRAAYRLERYDDSYEHLLEALELSPPDPDLLLSLFETLLRLGRTEEAIDVVETAVRLGPYHEGAHYQLGNGYSRKSYTQLFAAYPDAFADDAGRRALKAADALLAEGQRPQARAAYGEIAASHPGWADVAVRLGSLAFTGGDLRAARRHFLAALERCPEYGRAHNGLAKTLEAERLAIEVHRAAYEQRFAAREMPIVEGVERFVLNWDALTQRHRKQVATSIAPWRRYVPVLLEADATYYVKPLYELLSETPHQELLRDQRIAYDSRLWDDVRGCGGFHTVTGVEDVERTVLGRYDTVLHELTHQVHAVLPAERKRQIQELYRGAKERDAERGDAFLSRYAGASVWEYFAEGAHAYTVPRRDRFDTREIVRERLVERDPALFALVEELLGEEDVGRSYGVAVANRGDDHLRRGEAEAAIAAYRRALELAPGEEEALGQLIFALQVSGRAQEALEVAERASRERPESAPLAVRRANALWGAGRGLEAAIASLEKARGGLREEERHLADLELGRLRWVAGDAAGARAAFASVLAYQGDNPEALWGAAAAHALAEEWPAAWELYERAVRLRSGIGALRVDYARDLVRAAELARAPEQIQAALMLDPEDPQALALKGWWALRRGHLEEGRAIATEAFEAAPWSDLARVVQAFGERLDGRFTDARRTLEPLRQRIARSAPPEYVYRPRKATWEQVHTLPALIRSLLPQED